MACGKVKGRHMTQNQWRNPCQQPIQDSLQETNDAQNIEKSFNTSRSANYLICSIKLSNMEFMVVGGESGGILSETFVHMFSR